MDPITAMLLGALILTGCAKVGLAATSDAITTARASKAGQWDWLSQDRERRAASRQAWAKAWAERRRRRHEAAGGDGEFRPGARQYAKDLYHGYWEDRLERRTAKRAARPEYVYDPDRPSLAQRFDGAVLAKVERLRKSRGWDITKQAARRLVDPIPAKADRRTAEVESGDPLIDHFDTLPYQRDPRPAPTTPVPTDTGPGIDVDYHPPQHRERATDDVTGRVMEWTGSQWAPVCSNCDISMSGRDGEGWLTCKQCGTRAVDDQPGREAKGPAADPSPRRMTAAEMRAEWQELTAEAEEALDRGDWAAAVAALDEMEARYPSVYRNSGLRSTDTNAGTSWTGSLEHVRAKAALELQRQTNGQAATINDTTNGGTPMSAPTGEAVNFETAVPALAALTAATQNLSEHIAGAKQSATQFNDQVNEIDVARNDVALAVQSVMEQFTERHLDTSTMASVTAAMELIKAGDLSGAMDHVDAAVAKLASAETAALEASGATAEASQTVVSKFGDAAVTVASELGGDARFVDSSGGHGSTVTSPAALNVMSTSAAQRKDGLTANPGGSDGPIAAHAGYGQATSDSLPEAYSRDS